MLSKKEKEWIEKVIQKATQNELVRDITIERNAGPDGSGEIEKSTANLLDMLVISVPRLVRAVAGAESASNQSRNRSIEVLEKVGSVGSTLLSMEDTVRTMARFAIALQETGLLEQLEKVLEIEYTGHKAIEDETNIGQEEE